MNTPFLSVGNDELIDQPTIGSDDLVYCSDCHEFHPVKVSAGKCCTIVSMRCPITNKCFIVGVDGRLLNNWQKLVDTVEK